MAHSAVKFYIPVEYRYLKTTCRDCLKLQTDQNYFTMIDKS